jgi:hypothetical protein
MGARAKDLIASERWGLVAFGVDAVARSCSRVRAAAFGHLHAAIIGWPVLR